MDCNQTCKVVASNHHRENVHNWLGLGEFESIFKVMSGFNDDISDADGYNFY